jgi:hypothetical protein
VIALIFVCYVEQNHALGDMARHLLEPGIKVPKGKARRASWLLHLSELKSSFTGFDE